MMKQKSSYLRLQAQQQNDYDMLPVSTNLCMNLSLYLLSGQVEELVDSSL